MELTRKRFQGDDFKSSLSPQDCTARLQNAFGRKAPHLNTLRRWYADFDRGYVSLHDKIRKGDIKPTKLRQAKSIGKKRLRIFSKMGLVSKIPLEEQKTANGDWCTTICLLSVLEKVTEKRPRNRILCDAWCNSTMTMFRRKPRIRRIHFLTSEKVKLVTHPAFNPDLAPCDFIIFPKIKNLMRGLTFTGLEEAVIAFDEHTQNMPSDQWSSYFRKRFERMKKCKM
ncbi:hypothetical protein EVAR_33834_1 [Eumeta japonica]|uniref:Mos1 transposase HTH domain-containing protein n=1 Tax=Eumeta variegata TaxID=151549 RepID=A0A4C1VA25_EUMVA|nr:hypothetical protein EVAR_33834_1 [Eumeta japonica]